MANTDVSGLSVVDVFCNSDSFNLFTYRVDFFGGGKNNLKAFLGVILGKEGVETASEDFTFSPSGDDD